MKKIKNHPLTKTNDIPIKVEDYHKFELSIEIENPEKFRIEFLQNLGKINNENMIVSQTKGEESFVMTKIFPKKNKSNALFFPEPNLVIIFYNTAIEHINNTIKLQRLIVNNKWLSEDLFLVFSEFLQESFQGITQLIMSLEAQFNQLVPEEISINHKGKTYTKEKLEWEKFNQKFRFFLPKLIDVDIYKNYNIDYQNISKLNDLRNNLIHLKSKKNKNYTFYQSLFKELIDLDYEKHANSTLFIISLMKKD